MSFSITWEPYTLNVIIKKESTPTSWFLGEGNSQPIVGLAIAAKLLPVINTYEASQLASTDGYPN